MKKSVFVISLMFVSGACDPTAIGGKIHRMSNGEPFFYVNPYTTKERDLLSRCHKNIIPEYMQKPYSPYSICFPSKCKKYKTRENYCIEKAKEVCNPSSKYKIKDDEICIDYRKKYNLFENEKC
jgi:hypothetical protein